MSPETTMVNKAYQNFCHCIVAAAKKSVSRGRRNNYVPYCDDTFLQAQQGTKTDKKSKVLLTRLDAKQKEHRLETFNSIDFTHSSGLA